MRAGDLLAELWRAGTINGVTWMDVFYLHMACLTIILALLSPETVEQDWDREPEGHSPGPALTRSPPPLVGKTRRHVQRYGVGEMRDMVRLLCRVMASVEVCGTNARFAKVSLELAKATGIIDPDDPGFNSSPLPNARIMSEFQGTGTEDSSSGSGPGTNVGGSGSGVGSDNRRESLARPVYQQTPFQQQRQQQQQQPYYPLAGSSGGAGAGSGYPMWVTEPSPSSFPVTQNPPTGGPGGSGGNGVSLDFPGLPGNPEQQGSQLQGFASASAMSMSMAAEDAAAVAAATTAAHNPAPGGNAVQWDMVMPSSQWDDNVMDMDLTWDWQAPPMNPYQGPPGYQGNP